MPGQQLLRLDQHRRRTAGAVPLARRASRPVGELGRERRSPRHGARRVIEQAAVAQNCPIGAPDVRSPIGRNEAGRLVPGPGAAGAGDAPWRVVDRLAGMVIIGRCDRRAWRAFRGGAVFSAAGDLAVRLAEAYRLIAELTAQAGRMTAQVERWRVGGPGRGVLSPYIGNEAYSRHPVEVQPNNG